MGLFTWLSHGGAVGGLVRSFVDGYKTIRAANPDHSRLSDEEIFRHMVHARMSILPNVGHSSFMEAFLSNPSKGLRNVIVGILMAENESIDPWSLLEATREIIDEEFAQSGLPESVIEGEPEFIPSPPKVPSSPKPSVSTPLTSIQPKQAPAFSIPNPQLESDLVCHRCKTVIPQAQRGAHFTQCPKCETIITRNA